MAAKNYDVNGVIPSVRSQLTIYRGDAPLQQAAKEWYLELDEETRRQVEEACVDIAGTVKSKCPTGFGVTSALELLAALIAFDQGWLPGDEFRAQRMRLKYDQKWRHHHTYQEAER